MLSVLTVTVWLLRVIETNTHNLEARVSTSAVLSVLSSKKFPGATEALICAIRGPAAILQVNNSFSPRVRNDCLNSRILAPISQQTS